MSFFRSHIALIIAGAAILALLGANVAVVFLPWGTAGVALHLFLAFCMALVIAVLFMDMRHMGAMMRIFALGGLLWLVFMWFIIPVDYLTR